MHTRTVSFENRDGERIAALLDLPVDDRPIAFALLAHCFTCSKNYKGVAHVSRALAAEGVAVLRFDFTGLGDSEGEFADTNLTTNVADIVSASEFLRREYEAPAILVGHSLGGAAVLRAAVEVPSARAVATIAAPSSPSHLLRHLRPKFEEISEQGEAEIDIGGRPFRVKKQLLDDLERSSMHEAIENLQRALLIFHSPIDGVVGIDNATEIFVAAKHPKSFVSLDTADHLLSDREDSRYVGRMIATWARKYIGVTERQEKVSRVGDGRVIVRTPGSGFRTEILANGHPLTADEPEDVGGTNVGPSPYELLAAALGACTTMTLRMYADRKGWPLEAAEAIVEHGKTHCEDCADPGNPRSRIDHFERRLRLEGALDDEQRRRLLEVADRCPVHRTLHSEVKVATSLVEEP